jgi:Flp pilus assembly protein TadG
MSERLAQSMSERLAQPTSKTPSLWPKISMHLRREDGGAIVEFVALAIPLFIPIFLYLNSFSSISANEVIARSMAREVLRVYVISENDGAARNLVKLRIYWQDNGT